MATLQHVLRALATYTGVSQTAPPYSLVIVLGYQATKDIYLCLSALRLGDLISTRLHGILMRIRFAEMFKLKWNDFQFNCGCFKNEETVECRYEVVARQANWYYM